MNRANGWKLRLEALASKASKSSNSCTVYLSKLRKRPFNGEKFALVSDSSAFASDFRQRTASSWTSPWPRTGSLGLDPAPSPPPRWSERRKHGLEGPFSLRRRPKQHRSVHKVPSNSHRFGTCKDHLKIVLDSGERCGG